MLYWLGNWNWHKTVHRNDEIRTEAWLKGPYLHETKFAGRASAADLSRRFLNRRATGGRIHGRQLVCFRTARETHAREQGNQVQMR